LIFLKVWQKAPIAKVNWGFFYDAYDIKMILIFSHITKDGYLSHEKRKRELNEMVISNLS
jgi:hypothetical protein